MKMLSQSENPYQPDYFKEWDDCSSDPFGCDHETKDLTCSLKISLSSEFGFSIDEKYHCLDSKLCRGYALFGKKYLKVNQTITGT